ncbi:hypothetical protein [Algibacter sp. PT7-4]|uniref:hypothetical protein n=1 Tax=Algibacter ulvanivorans TaxID=3400999 RepID=UPI003AB038F5
MNTKKIIVLSGLMLVFLSLSSFKSLSGFNANLITKNAQEGLIVYGVYDGKEDYGYNFITKDRDGEEQTLTFQVVKDDVLVTFNLNEDTLIGTKFKITFNRDLKLSKDEDGMDDEDEINTIIKLEKV